jgi:hypothetical protein
MRRLAAAGLSAVALAVAGCSSSPPSTQQAASAPPRAATPLSGRLLAVGIPGAGAISPVGVFHPGGPIHDKPEFAAFTQPGRLLDPERLLVASTSNFGAPIALANQPTGAVLSVSTDQSEPIVVPADFAATGGQASALDGSVQLYTAQSPAFANSLTRPDAVTADLTAVSNPLAISINDGFGRPWFANGASTETVIDPDGRPLADPPSATAGGVFAGDQTNRADQRILGQLTRAAIGTALIGKSADGSGKAVFATVNADGSVVQVHVKLGVDGLAPAGTISPLSEGRAGAVFNWVPDRILFVADPGGNGVLALTLSDDGTVFQVDQTRRLSAPELATPIDLAPAVPEIANPDFSSNTTLAGGSDLYIANRGNGTLVRMRQDGTVVAVRQVEVPGLGPVGAGQINGVAVSPDAQRIWVTLSGTLPDYPNQAGAVIELPAFGGAQSPSVAGPSTSRPAAPAPSAPAPVAPAAAPVASAPVGPTLHIVRDEDFSSLQQGWLDGTPYTWLDGLGYHLADRVPTHFVAVGSPNREVLGDTVVSASFRKISGPAGGGYGLILRDQNPEQRDGADQGGRYYVLEVSDVGDVGIWRREIDHWVDLVPWQRADAAIHPGTGTNVLTAQAIGSHLSLIVNGITVASVDDASLTAGGVGLFAGGDGNEVVIESLRVQAAD